MFEKIFINTIENLQEFIKIVSKYDCPIEAWNEGDNRVYSVSSIISIFALDFSKKIYVKINSEDKNISNNFYKEIKRFKEETNK